VRIGQAITGRIISAAAAIMTVVFFAFTFTTDRTIKMIGLGMAAAVVTDALVVRTVLVPAVMHTLGSANWRLPAILDRCLPHLNLEDSDEAADLGEDATEGTGELRPVTKTSKILSLESAGQLHHRQDA